MITNYSGSVLNNAEVRFPKPARVLPYGTVPVSAMAIPPSKVYPYHQCGAIFEGLAPTASLQICLNIIVENFPSVTNRSLTPLMKPSAKFDPMALQLYSHAIGNMPVGVMVSENGLGEWFARTIREVEPFITPIASAIHPGLGVVSRGVGAAARGYLDSRPQKQTMMVSNGPGLNTGKSTSHPKKKKKTKSKNSKLAAGNRGKSGRIQGPLRQ
jgi:hypothetical protein